MPVTRTYKPIPVNVTDSGVFLPDVPLYRLAPSDYSEKLNFERFDGTERKRCGWDYPAPMGDWLSEMLGTFDSSSPCEAIRGVRRPNGTYAIVGCGGGKIKVFSYDADAWVTIGSGYSTAGTPGFRYWQIEDIAGYAIFNNGLDCPCWWQIGDVSVTPIYEFREQGYASAATMTEYYGVLIFANILVIQDAYIAALLNGPNPFRTIGPSDAVGTQRIGFMRVWSNIGDPRDFAAEVSGAISATSNHLVVAWPMPSFQVGDLIVVEGAGASAGNLESAIISIAGTSIFLADNAITTVTTAPVLRATAVNSIVGSDQLEGDGSDIVIEKGLKGQLISYKQSGQIYQSYYTGNTDKPFASQQIGYGDRSVRFPRALVNYKDQYHIFPGASQFFKYELSAQQPEEMPIFVGAEKSAFFDHVATAGPYDVWAAINSAVGHVFFAYPVAGDEEEAGYAEYSARRVLSLNFNAGQESLDQIDGFNFLCAATVNKPTTDFTCNARESWFLMGDTNGKITLYGRSNLTLFTGRRYGEFFDSVVSGGLIGSSMTGDFEGAGAATVDKYFKRLTLLLGGADSTGAVTVQLYGAIAPNAEPVLLATKILTNPTLPAVLNGQFRRAYFKYRMVTSVDTPLRIGGHVWLLSAVDIRQISQIGPA